MRTTRGSRPRLMVAGLVAAAVAVVTVVAPAVPVSAAPAGAPPRLAPAPGVDPDPGTPGPLTVDELEYDLGDQAFRPDGFPAPVEVKGKVYAPASLVGEAPIVILLHGRHVTCAGDGDALSLEWPCPVARPEVPSYQGYDALGRLLASHGSIVVSIGGNGINAVDGFVLDGGAAGRAQLVLEHLRLWQRWHAQADGPFGTRFVGHVDLTHIGLMGHSRGGEGVVAAAQLNQRRGAPYGIRAVVALAPVDFGRRVLGGVHLQVVLPFCDGDVSDLQGASYYDDGRYGTPGDLSIKQTTLLYGANHNFFNTVWTAGPGSADDAEYMFYEGSPGIEPCRPEAASRLTGPQQAAAGATIMGGFLRRFVQDDLDFQPFVTGVTAYPASTGPARWAVAHHGGDRLELARWATGDDARFDRPGRPGSVSATTTGLVCMGSPFGDEGGSPACPDIDSVVGSSAALDVGWIAPTATVRTDLAPTGTDVTGYDGIRLRLAFPPDARNDRRSRQDASLRVTDATGASATVPIGTYAPAFARRPAGGVRHTVLNGVRVPLSAFGGVDLTRVRSVEVRFDRTPSGRALLSDLAFTAEGTGERVGPPDGAPPPGPPPSACESSAAARWACAVAITAWGRAPMPGPELDGIARAHGSSSARAARMAALVDGPTAGFGALVRTAQVMLGDAFHPFYISLALSATGRRWEAALAYLATYVPYTSGATTTAAGVVEAVFVALVGRRPEPTALAFWAPRVEASDPVGLARALMASTEWANRVVTARYLQIAGRVPDAAGRAFWRTRVRQPRGEQSLVASLLASAPVVTRTAQPGF